MQSFRAGLVCALAASRRLKLYLHNHTVEFENTYLYDINKDGHPVMTPAWQAVAAETDPRYVSFGVDAGLKLISEAQP